MGDIVKKEPMTPGFGVAGQVMCRNSSLTPKMCLKQGCEGWIELKCGEHMVARCSDSWVPVLMVEQRVATDKLRESVDKLREAMNANNKQQKTETAKG